MRAFVISDVLSQMDTWIFTVLKYACYKSTHKSSKLTIARKVVKTKTLLGPSQKPRILVIVPSFFSKKQKLNPLKPLTTHHTGRLFCKTFADRKTNRVDLTFSLLYTLYGNSVVLNDIYKSLVFNLS